MFRRMKEKRKIRKEALKFRDKICRLSDLFKIYGFDIRSKFSLYYRSSNFIVSFESDSTGKTIELIKKLSEDIVNVEENPAWNLLSGRFYLSIVNYYDRKEKEINDQFVWQFTYKCSLLKQKLNYLDNDIRVMEKVIFNKEKK